MELGALILFTSRLEQMVAFYRAIGVPLEEEHHESDDAEERGGETTPRHFACDLGRSHFAVFETPSASPSMAPGYRTAGGAMPGFAVPSLEAAYSAVCALGFLILQPPTPYPWGPRFLVEDPDGRAVEVFQRGAGAAK